MPFEVASSPLLLRSYMLDSSHVKNLSRQVDEVVTAVMGARFVNEKEDYLKIFSCLAYYCACALGSPGGRTLGNEDTDLIPVTMPASFKYGDKVPPSLASIPSSRLRQMTAALLYASLDSFTKYISQRLLPHADSEIILARVEHIHLTFFFLFASYVTIAHRMTRTRFLAINPAHQKKFEGKNVYFALGVMMAIENSYLLLHLLKRLLFGRSRSTDSDDETDDEEDEEKEQSEELKTGTCILCLGKRIVPTATACGHIFCWKCIQDWLKAQQFCPLCRERCQLNTLVPLIQYNAPQSR